MGVQSTRPKARVKSIQYGSVILNGVQSATSIITAVDPAKTVLIFLGYESDTNDIKTAVRLTLTNSITVTGNRNAGAGSISTGNFCAVEFF